MGRYRWFGTVSSNVMESRKTLEIPLRDRIGDNSLNKFKPKGSGKHLPGEKHIGNGGASISLDSSCCFPDSGPCCLLLEGCPDKCQEGPSHKSLGLSGTHRVADFAQRVASLFSTDPSGSTSVNIQVFLFLYFHHKFYFFPVHSILFFSFY